jgi:hypothetical protein
MGFEGLIGELKLREPRMPEEKPPPTLAWESVASMEQRKTKATAKTHIIFNQVFLGKRTSDLMIR